MPAAKGPTQSTAKPVVGVIGLGSLGDGMARSVLAGRTPTWWSATSGPRRPRRYRDEAEVAESDGGLCARRGGRGDRGGGRRRAGARGALRAGGGLAVAGPETVFVVVSTISTECVEAIGAEAATAGRGDRRLRGVRRSRPRPRAASSSAWSAVTPRPSRARPSGARGHRIPHRHMGPFGAGLTAKLARNLVQYGSWLAAYEGQVLAEAAGIELSKLAEAIRVSDTHIGGSSRLMFRTTVAPLGDGRSRVRRRCDEGRVAPRPQGPPSRTRAGPAPRRRPPARRDDRGSLRRGLRARTPRDVTAPSLVGRPPGYGRSPAMPARRKGWQG